MTPEHASDLKSIVANELWRRGIVGDWYLKPRQLAAMRELEQMRSPFFEASRRYGKTTTVLSYVLEEALRRPKLVVRWCEPWKHQCREIVMTEMDQIQAPIELPSRFTYKTTDSFYEAPNGSRIFLRGVNEDKGESARGTKADIIVADELGSWRDPDYVLTHVLRPQLLTTRGKLVRTGTPPRNLAHIFYDMKKKAAFDGHFIGRTIYDQELVSWEAVEEFVEEMGGWDSPAVRRELLCERIKDEDAAIIPEWSDEFIGEPPRDDLWQFWLRYWSLDIGVRDLTVAPVAYYDFVARTLVVLDEVVLFGKRMTTEALADEIRAKEQEHFGVKWTQEPGPDGRLRWKCEAPRHHRIRRVTDVDLRLVNDMSALHGLYFDPTDKGHLEEMVNEVRLWVKAGRLRVHPRCKVTIDTLRYGMWDEDRKAWERTESLGHCDALAALMYLIRNVDTRTNPVPADHGRPHSEFFHTGNAKTPADKLREMLNIQVPSHRT